MFILRLNAQSNFDIVPLPQYLELKKQIGKIPLDILLFIEPGLEINPELFKNYPKVNSVNLVQKLKQANVIISKAKLSDSIENEGFEMCFDENKLNSNL